MNGQEKVQLDGFVEAMQNDLNSPLALSKLEDYISSLEGKNIDRASIIDAISIVDQIFGLKLSDVPDIQKEQKDIIKQREDARKTKDFSKADKLRSVLARQNIGLNDQQTGSTWYYLS